MTTCFAPCAWDERATALHTRKASPAMRKSGRTCVRMLANTCSSVKCPEKTATGGDDSLVVRAAAPSPRPSATSAAAGGHASPVGQAPPVLASSAENVIADGLDEARVKQPALPAGQRRLVDELEEFDLRDVGVAERVVDELRVPRGLIRLRACLRNSGSIPSPAYAAATPGAGVVWMPTSFRLTGRRPGPTVRCAVPAKAE